MKKNGKKIAIILLVILGIVWLVRSVRFQSVEDYNRETDQITKELQMKEVEEDSVSEAAVGAVTEEPGEKNESVSSGKSTVMPKKTGDPKSTAEPSESPTKKPSGKTTKKTVSPGKTAVPKVTSPPDKKQDKTTAQPNKREEGMRCTIDIRCDDILSHMGDVSEDKRKYVPSDGVILSTVEVTIQEGDTVYDVLAGVCRSKKIALDVEFSATFDTYYIKGIANLYEFMAGETSGWMYRVNEEYPNVGASAYQVKNGDAIHWVYSCRE